jgi:creatinine amidohydrolase
VADWAHSSGVQRLLILNGHYTNFAPLRCALEDIRVDLPDMRIGLRSLWTLSPAIHDHYHEDGANWHGNHAETSLCLHWAPDQVHMDRAVDEPDRAQAMDAVFSYRVDQETPTGIVGRPSTANADSGAGFADELVAALVALLERAKTEDTPIDWAAKRPEFS